MPRLSAAGISGLQAGEDVKQETLRDILRQIRDDLRILVAKKTAPRVPKQAELSDDEWLAALRTNPAYRDVDVIREYEKMKTWCAVNKKQATRRRFINWLNRHDREMSVQSVKPTVPLPPAMMKTYTPRPPGEAPPPEVKQILDKLVGRRP